MADKKLQIREAKTGYSARSRPRAPMGGHRRRTVKASARRVVQAFADTFRELEKH